jgi:hypothetical protein
MSRGPDIPAVLVRAANPLIRDHVDHAPAGQGEIETEGLGLMASDMGYQCWGMPNLRILHYPG